MREAKPGYRRRGGDLGPEPVPAPGESVVASVESAIDSGRGSRYYSFTPPPRFMRNAVPRMGSAH